MGQPLFVPPCQNSATLSSRATSAVLFLTPQLEGAKAKEFRDQLKLDQLEDLPTVEQAEELIAEKARENVPERP